MSNKNIDFVARHYRNGGFDADSGWKRLGITPVSIWKRYRVAAAVAATVVISATAAIIYRDYQTADVQQPAIEAPAVSPLAEIKVIDFENASLADVVGKIEAVYDVKVVNLPAQNSGYQLSLHYEGTPAELIEVINDILGTQMAVVEI